MTAIHYNYFRDYEPALGRYLESDPVGLSAGLNTYGYVGGDPLGFIDPTGENSIALGAGIGFSVGGPGGAAVGALIGGAAMAYLICKATDNTDRCRKEWEDARERCRNLLSGPNPPRGLTGGYSDIEKCAKGFVSEACGGNPIDWGRKGRGRK